MRGNKYESAHKRTSLLRAQVVKNHSKERGLEDIVIFADRIIYSMANTSWQVPLEIKSLVIGTHKFLQDWREKHSE